MKIMQKALLNYLFVVVILSVSFDYGYGQRTRKRDTDRKETTAKFSDQLWYGGGFGLGFYGGRFSGEVQNEFFISISPMVGYKVTEFLSFGPRVELGFLTGKYGIGNGEVVGNSSLNYGVGLFSRAKFIQVLFAHVEYTYNNREIIEGLGGTTDNPKLITSRVGDDQFLVGLGYHSGFPWGTEISLLYDFLEPEDSEILPIVIRFGLTYNF